MAHIFEDYLRNEYEVKTVTVEKNTKKAVKEALEQIGEITNVKGFKRYLIKVDATALNDEDKIAQLVANSLFHFRNFSTHIMRVTEVELNSSFNEEFDENDFELFLSLKRRGGKWENYLEEKDVDWVALNACLKESLHELLDKLENVTQKYKGYIQQVTNERIKLTMQRKWSFGRSSTSLMSLYKRCFDEVSRILDPRLQYNPSPSFQRDLVWSVEKKQSFIESIVNEIPIGSFYINMEEIYDPNNELGEGFGGLVWDGKQRLHALDSFIKGEFQVEIEGKKVSYFDNPGYFNIRFDSCGITVFESRFNDLKDIIHAYVVINQSQVKHTDEDLQKAIDYLEMKSKANN